MQKFAPSLLAVGLAAALVGCQESGPQDDKVTSMVIGTENCPKAMILGKEIENRVILDFVDKELVKRLEILGNESK